MAGESLMKNFDFIGTLTNKKFHFLNPHADEVCIEDISHALSMNCRYSGHVKEFYSVAEHCCHIHDLVEAGGEDKDLCLSALMHDASEAYLCDIPRPIKPHLNNYFELEAKAEKVIQEKYGFAPMNWLIKYYDIHICGDEARQLFLTSPDWAESFHKLGVIVQTWSPSKAKQQFMKRFNKHYER
jgi:hypothetical protein